MTIDYHRLKDIANISQARCKCVVALLRAYFFLMKKIMFNDKYGLTQAVLEGRKTQTRRIVSDSLVEDYENWLDDVMCIAVPPGTTYERIEDFLVKRSRYRVGEIVAIDQSYKDIHEEVENETLEMLDLYCSNGWNNKMFVRADACKHQMRITKVSIERLKDISNEDCLKEGVVKCDTEVCNNQCYLMSKCNFCHCGNAKYTPREAYAALIDKVSGKGTWERNPYVFVYDFEQVK